MALYSVGSATAGTPQAMTTTLKTLAALTAATGATTLRKGWIYDVLFGTDGTPADNAMTFQIDRQSSVGTGTSATPIALDNGDAAALLVATVNHTIEPTVTANSALLSVGINQRASYRWVAAPGGEIVVPATNVTGVGLRAKSPAYTGTATGHIHFRE
jgi:hypothetical protein